ncbi:MAG TPA: LEA type 2 family protein [Pseudomonadales bacterium]
MSPEKKFKITGGYHSMRHPEQTLKLPVKPVIDLRWLVLLIIFFCGGCATVAKTVLKEPEVTVAGFRVISANLMAQRFGIKLKVDNPNAIPLPINKISYDVELAGKNFITGETDKAFRVPAKGSETFEIQVNLNLLESASYMSAILNTNGGVLDYKLKGQVDVDLPLLGSVPINKVGTIKLTR